MKVWGRIYILLGANYQFRSHVIGRKFSVRRFVEHSL